MEKDVCYNEGKLKKKNSTFEDTAKKILEIAADHKAISLKLLKTDPSCGYADYLVIMSATSDRHARSLADAILGDAKKTNNPEGYTGGQWILMDLGPIVVHIFQEDIRDYYNFDKLWGHVPSQTYPFEKNALDHRMQLPA